jgi:hypothetical protein
MTLGAKISDWLFDVVKYVLTAVLITSFLGSFQDTWKLYVFGAVVVTISFILAVILFWQSKNNKNK